MKNHLQTARGAAEMSPTGWIPTRFSDRVLMAACLLGLLIGNAGRAQVNVLTAHNDNLRDGVNAKETTLTPGNVNPTHFGKLFSHAVSGALFAQPLYVANVAIPGNGTHNIVYVAPTSGTVNGVDEGNVGDFVYAFDADTNGGANANPLWQVSLLTNTSPAGTYTVNRGVLGTPVIDAATKTLYLVSSEFEGKTPIFRFHALDITTGAEKFGGPLLMNASVPGTGSGSVGGVLSFDPTYQIQRPGMLFLNGVVYVAFGSNSDQGPWHGWIFSYSVNPSTNKLSQVDVFCTSPNGSGGAIWMSGSGLAAEVFDASKPYGRMFASTGNGSFSSTSPYSYSESILNLDLTGGKMTVKDTFTPYNEAALDAQDGDVGSSGPVLLPSQTLASGKTLRPLVAIGKSGMFYILDRDTNADGSNNTSTEYSPSGLGEFNTDSDHIVQELQTPVVGGRGWGAGVWGSEAYWNNSIYVSGTQTYSAKSGNSLRAYSFVKGALSTSPTMESVEQFSYPGPTPSVSANGTTNGIVWVLKTDALDTLGSETLLAYDATNLAKTLYSSDTNLDRDSPGPPVKYNVPTIADGKVFVGATGMVSVYGELGVTPTTPVPVINPSSGTFSGTLSVKISDSIAGATIYYTTDGSTPTTASAIYKNPLVITTNETVTAIGSATGYLISAPVAANFLSSTTPVEPTFSLAAGTYTGPQTLKLSTSTLGAIIYYTVDGPAPTTASSVYTQPLLLSTSATVQAIAVAQGGYVSSVTSAAYTIQPVGTINYPEGFSLAKGPIQFNGSTALDDFRLQLTDGGTDEAGSAFYATPVNIQKFTTQFTFQQSNPAGDGMTFTIQNNSPGALGKDGGSLGYQGIGKSIAIKFDLHDDAGEGSNSTGLYTDGAAPTEPSINLAGTGIDLHKGDFINATLTYNGKTLIMTLTDAITLVSWSHSFTVDIPSIVGGNTAYVGFTGGTGGVSSSQKLTSWFYLPGAPAPDYGAGFAPGGLTLNGGSTLNGTRLRLTDGKETEARSAFFSTIVNVQQFSSNFDFQLTNPIGDGFTFTIQSNGPTALGSNGRDLGYAGIAKSVAIKFDLYSNKGEGPDSTGIYTNGAEPILPSIDLTAAKIDLHSGDLFHVQLSYDGAILTVTITDTVTQASATQNYPVNIPAILGESAGYVGFTAGSGSSTAIQEILDWTYSPFPLSGPAFSNGFAGAPATLTLNGGAAYKGARLRLTDGNADEARSVFYTKPVNVQQFTNDFDFQITNPKGDGFTFTIQGGALTALGSDGGSLGYAGIGKSVAIKFDIYSNSGEGPDSTGLYINGADPELPAIDLSSTGINLHSGDIFNAHMVYNGTTLTVVITDTATNASATHTYTVNIPKIVGGSTAYAGFTGASGGATAIQEILDWKYSAAAVQ